MPSRAKDWLLQARKDLEHSRSSTEAGHYEWACFAAQQAAEKALKALYQFLGGEARGHSVRGLVQNLPRSIAGGSALAGAAMRLDKHYIPARYPNSYPEGAPCEFYTREEAERAFQDAEQILRFCDGHLAGS